MTADRTAYPDDMYATPEDGVSVMPQDFVKPAPVAPFRAPKPRSDAPAPSIPSSVSLPDADLPLFTPKAPVAITTASDLVTRCKLYMSPADVEKVREAYRYADAAHLGQFRKSGEPYITHPLAVATILASWKMDAQTVEAGLMHDVLEDTPTSKQDMVEHFGVEVANLVDGVSKLDKLKFSSVQTAQAESFRKMLLAMSRDVRVIIVKLADRIHNMRTLGVMRPEKRARIAKETLEIYVPIAHRLGLNNVFRELQELSFANRYPLRYQVLYTHVLKQRNERRAILERILRETRDFLNARHIRNRIIGRDRTIYGIYNKMRESHQSFSEALDIYGFRVIVRTVNDCYLTLGALHALYKPVHRRFKDFIAIPKTNGYQSLHTTVIGPKGVPVEFQIRTEEMHRIAEYGLLTQWLFKNDVNTADIQSRTAAWLKSLMEIQSTTADSGEFIENIKVDLFPNRIYVFTPRGKLVSVPKGSTAVDFAYQVHTEIGNTAVGCRINGEPQPLSKPLSNGDMVEILTDKKAAPSPEWLEFVRSGRARAEIRQYLRNCRYEESVALGRKALEHLADENHIALETVPDDVWHRLETELSVESLDSLYASIGLGKDLPAAVFHRLVSMIHEAEGGEAPAEQLPKVMIRGNEGVAVELSQCCYPIPGDEIVGYSRSGHGLEIHRADCPHARHAMQAEPSRWMKVDWAPNQNFTTYAAPLAVRIANPRAGVAAVATAVAEAHSSITGLVIDDEYPDKYLRLIVQVRDKSQLGHVMRMISERSDAISVKRTFEAGLPPERRHAAAKN
jgi:GTP diphosphokinase / guanosine-3',5'-bis(diphosphate) 3'-diphosphatase